jgi:hypothetical protein
LNAAINKYVLHILTLTIFVSWKTNCYYRRWTSCFLLAAFLDPQKFIITIYEKTKLLVVNFSCW